MYAFTCGHEVGIDVERLREIPEMEQIAQRFFSSDEWAALTSLLPGERLLSFYLAWTRKEAYVKAVGDGLHIPLGSFSVTLRPREPARLVRFDQDAALARDWQIHNLEAPAGYAAALAYCGPRRHVHLLSIDELPDVPDSL
jgi:4'-phosphopantetheinyl transferase